MIFGFIAKHRGIWPVRWMCGMLDVSPSGFYEWVRRPVGARARQDMQLLAQVRASFTGSDESYGARRVWRDLLAWDSPAGYTGSSG
jgi:putative transposase